MPCDACLGPQSHNDWIGGSRGSGLVSSGVVSLSHNGASWAALSSGSLSFGGKTIWDTYAILGLCERFKNEV